MCVLAGSVSGGAMYSWMLVMVLSSGIKTMYFPSEATCHEVAEWFTSEAYVIDAKCFRSKEGE